MNEKVWIVEWRVLPNGQWVPDSVFRTRTEARALVRDLRAYNIDPPEQFRVRAYIPVKS